MTNAKAIEVLRSLRQLAIDPHNPRLWQQVFEQEQANVAALEHAITMLGMLELSGKPDYYDTAPGI